MTSTRGWTVAAKTRDRLGESALWHPRERAIYWIDWYGPILHRLRLSGREVESWRIPGSATVGSFVFATGGRPAQCRQSAQAGTVP